MNGILKYEDILKISEFLRENGYINYRLDIVNEIPDKKLLNRIDDDFFYRINKCETDKPNNDSDEVVINIGDVRFVYKLKEEE